MSDFTHKDNTQEVLSALEHAIGNGLTAIGFTAERHAKEIISEEQAVDTGRLRNSITFAISGKKANIQSYRGDHGEEGGTYSGTAPESKDKCVYIGSGVKYAAGIELGTHRKKGAVHMLQRAATEHTEEYKQLMKDAMESAEE